MATYTNFDNEIFSQKALEGFVAELAPFMAFSTNFSPDPVQKGDTVLVPLIGGLTATTFSGSYAVCGGTMTAVTVSINKHKIVPVGQSDLTAAGSSMANLSKFAYQQGAALATLILQDVFTLCTTANFGLATAVAVAAMDVPQIRVARKALNQANVPKTPRSLILDCEPYDTLLGVTNFVQAHMFGDRAAIAEGRVARALGFDLFELNALFPATSVMGLAVNPAAIAVAMRYLQPQRPERYDYASPISDPGTGLTMGMRDHYDPNTGTRYINLEANYGFSVGISNAARVIKRTD
jgi:hypothetical protein